MDMDQPSDSTRACSAFSITRASGRGTRGTRRDSPSWRWRIPIFSDDGWHAGVVESGPCERPTRCVSCDDNVYRVRETWWVWLGFGTGDKLIDQ